MENQKQKLPLMAMFCPIKIKWGIFMTTFQTSFLQRRAWRYQRGNQNLYISKKNRHHNYQKKKYKKTNNDLQNIHILVIDQVTRTPLKFQFELSEENMFCILANQKQECLWLPCCLSIQNEMRNVCIGSPIHHTCNGWFQMAK